MKRLIILVLMCTMLIASTTDMDNYSVLMVLKESAMNVIEQNQDLINTNKDGSHAKKGFDKGYVAKKTYSAFVEVSKGKDWNIKKLKGSSDKNQLAQALTAFLAQARIVVAKAQPIINSDTDGSVNSKNFYPAVFGRLTADEFLKRSGIKIKQTTLGKGMGPRNKACNTPDSWETQALHKLSELDLSSSYGFGEEVSASGKKVYRYIHPLVVKDACLSCHGAPKGEKDISGYIKEGYNAGDLRGGISVIIP